MSSSLILKRKAHSKSLLLNCTHIAHRNGVEENCTLQLEVMLHAIGTILLQFDLALFFYHLTAKLVLTELKRGIGEGWRLQAVGYR